MLGTVGCVEQTHAENSRLRGTVTCWEQWSERYI